jgi:hypothetical protein
MEAEFTVEHIRQYIGLWANLADVNLHEDIEDDISGNLTQNGHYSSQSAYRAQFFGATLSPIVSSVWKLWAPPNIKLFTWLALQNRLWKNDLLRKRG